MQKDYDYIIIGAGSAGSVIANRLSADKNTSVCLLEAGGTHKNWRVRIPGASILMLNDNKRSWLLNTVPQAGLNNRVGYQPRGRMLGGSSSVNAQVYIRGHKWDYDNWAAHGNDGWSYEEVLPYFKRSEHREAGADDFHGQGGELNVAPLRDPSPVNEAFLKSCEELQIQRNPDFNGAEQEGVGLFEVTQKNGERWSTARAFLDPIMDRENLTILKEAHTEKILIEDGRATGVRFRHKDGPQTLTARKEVILSAGAFGSPQILLLSGIGAEDKLSPHGIEQVHNLPGVGENLQDHIDWISLYQSNSLDTIGFSLRGFARSALDMWKYRTKRMGQFTTQYAESGGFLYTDKSEPAPDIQLHFVRAIVDDHGRKTHWGHGYSCHVCVLRPKSRGTVTLNSADPLAPPAIDPGFLSDERDMETLYKGARIVQNIMKGAAFEGIRGKSLYGSEASDPEELKEDIRNRSDTVYHPVGSCKMGRDDMAVVDPQLKVHGIKGLRVADASIMPFLVSGNTNAPSIMIGEKCADMILNDA